MLLRVGLLRIHGRPLSVPSFPLLRRMRKPQPSSFTNVSRSCACSRMTTIAATSGTASRAPTRPPAAAPTIRLVTTRNGGTPMVLFMTMGTRTFPSSTWITT